MDEHTQIKIEVNDLYGRYIVAANDLKEGDVILKEKALVVGPKIKGDLVCLNCYNVFHKRFHVCTICKLAPLCGPICEDHQGGHSETECQVFKSIRDKLTVPQLLSSYHLITIIRCLLLRKLDDQKSWNNLMNLECHIDKRKDSSIWKFHEESNKIIKDVGLINKNDLDDMTVQKICAVMDINSFELRTPLNGQGRGNTDSICGIFPMAAMMAHNCVSNTHISIDDTFTMTVRAAVAIEKGKTLFINYTNSLQGSIERRHHLRKGKYFECCCERCADGTELNTHMSSIKCSHCTGGLVIMVNPTNISQYSQHDLWKCCKCDKQYYGNEIKEILDNIYNSLPDPEDNEIENYQAALLLVSQYLPPTHNIIIDLKHKLAGMLRDFINISFGAPKHVIQEKYEICREFLPLLDILEPGISRLKECWGCRGERWIVRRRTAPHGEHLLHIYVPVLGMDKGGWIELENRN